MNITLSPDNALETFNARKLREYAPAIAYSALVIVLGIVGNDFTVVYYGFHVPRTSTNVIITALGTADLIACIAFCDEIIELCFTVTFQNVAGCKIMYLCNHTLVITSGCILLLVAVDRYRQICAPFAWQLSVKWVRIAIVSIVVFSVLHSARKLVIFDVVRVNVTDPVTDRVVEAFYCTESREPDMKKIAAGFHALDMTTFIMVIGSCVVLYSLIARALWLSKRKMNKGPSQDHFSIIYCHDTSGSHVHISNTNRIPGLVTDDNHTNTQTTGQKSKRKSKKETNAHANMERKLTLMMLTITVASISSFIPYYVVNINIKQTESSEQEFSAAVQVALRSFMLNSAVNPYIIGLFNTQFRAYVKGVMCRCVRK